MKYCETLLHCSGSPSSLIFFTYIPEVTERSDVTMESEVTEEIDVSVVYELNEVWA